MFSYNVFRIMLMSAWRFLTFSKKENAVGQKQRSFELDFEDAVKPQRESIQRCLAAYKKIREAFEILRQEGMYFDIHRINASEH